METITKVEKKSVTITPHEELQKILSEDDKPLFEHLTWLDESYQMVCKHREIERAEFPDNPSRRLSPHVARTLISTRAAIMDYLYTKYNLWRGQSEETQSDATVEK